MLIFSLIQIQVSAILLLKFSGSIPLSVSAITLSSWKLTSCCMRNMNKSPKMSYYEWWGKWKSGLKSTFGLDHYQTLSDSSDTKFQWNWLITFAVILLTDRQTDRRAKKPDRIHNRIQLLLSEVINLMTLWWRLWLPYFLNHYQQKLQKH